VSEMSLFQGFETMRLIKVGPSWREQLEEKISRRWMVARLADFRRQLAQDMEPEPWVVLEAPAPTFLADLCGALGLGEQERAEVLGVLGLAVLNSPYSLTVRQADGTLNDRQMKALAHAEGNGGIDARTFRRLCPHWSVETLRLDLSRLDGVAGQSRAQEGYALRGGPKGRENCGTAERLGASLTAPGCGPLATPMEAAGHQDNHITE
jgi:hypothetical protein